MLDQTFEARAKFRACLLCICGSTCEAVSLNGPPILVGLFAERRVPERGVDDLHGLDIRILRRGGGKNPMAGGISSDVMVVVETSRWSFGADGGKMSISS